MKDALGKVISGRTGTRTDLALFAASLMVSMAVGAVVAGLIYDAFIPFSLSSALQPLLLAALLLWPLATFYRRRLWKIGVLEAWTRERKATLLVTAGLFLLSVVVYQYGFGPVARLLLLPVRVVTGPLYAATSLYRGIAGRTGVNVLFNAGLWSFQLIWLYLIADGGTRIWAWLDDTLSIPQLGQKR